MRNKRVGLLLAVVTLLVVLISVQAVWGYTTVGVYGQPDMTTGTPNSGGEASANTLNYPLGLSVDASGGVYVADRNNHRVLFYANDGDNTADRVYGQHGDLTAHIANHNGAGNSGGTSPDNLNMPTAVTLDTSGGLFIADRDNHRVLYFANDGDTTADRVYGQFGNFNTNMTNNDGTGAYGEPSADNIGTYVLGLAIDSQDGLYVADSSNHRVLYFANDGDTTADRVYGQDDDFTTNIRNKGGQPSADSLQFPRGLAVDASDGLYIADRDNNRILYFANDGNTTADRVYGQLGNFSTNIESNDGAGNIGTPSADNLSHPKGVSVLPNGGLLVADSLHHRVLYFANDGDTTANGVGGQGMSMETGVANNDGNGVSGSPSDVNFTEPQGIVALAGGVFYVTDTGNNRILKIECPQWAN